MQKPSTRYLQAWLIWLIAAAFYAYEFYLRVSPAVLIPDLMLAFHSSAAALGKLSADYYYVYALMQIPVGVLLDRYGIRSLLTFAALLVTTGCILFATTDQLWVAESGRVFMGIGSAFSFVGCVKLARNWFSPKTLPLVIGLTNSCGVIGAIGSAAPLAFLLSMMDWRNAMLISSVIGAFLALLIRFVIKDVPKPEQEELEEDYTSNSLFQGLERIIKCRKTWLTALYGSLLVAPIAAFAELWSVPFLMHSHSMSLVSAAAISSLIFVGIGVGGPFYGALVGWLDDKRAIMFSATLGSMISFLIIVYAPHMSAALDGIVLFGFGFFTSHMLLIFSINTNRHPPWASATVIAFSNMVIMIGGGLFQPLIGWFIDINMRHSEVSNILDLSIENYHYAFAVLPVMQLIALFLIPSITKKST